MLADARKRMLKYAYAAAGSLAALSEGQLPLGGSLNVTAAVGAGDPDARLAGAADGC